MGGSLDVNRINIEDIDLQDVYEFMSLEKHPNGTLQGNPKIHRYLELMEKTRNMYSRINEFGNRESIAKHLIEFEGLSKYKAKQIIEDALEYFYADSVISKSAWRNILVDKMEKIINFSLQVMESVQDAQRISKMLREQAKILALDQPDAPELPDMTKPFKILSYNSEDFENLPVVNARKLAHFIDNLDLTEPEKIKIKKEASLMNIEIPFLPKTYE